MIKIIITGGCGFIGSNLALKLSKNKNYKIIVIDNLSRYGSKNNLTKIKKIQNIEFHRIDLSNFKKLNLIIKKHSNDLKAVFHLAAQVAVTTSIEFPIKDFNDNTISSLNLLESIRLNCKQKPNIIYSSTNKVYGGLDNLGIKEKKLRYEIKNKKDIDENVNVDFHSPYGCSKGSADFYFQDYNRIFGFKNYILRQSCIYGPLQYGIEDQGWVSWFISNAIKGKKINLYGNGKQVRDLLHIDDLISLYEKMIFSKKNYGVYNTGGGYINSVSLLEMLSYLEEISKIKVNYIVKKFRPGDQKVFISDNSKLKKNFNWKPKINVEKGMESIIQWEKTKLS